MWFPTPSYESVTRPRIAVAAVSAVATASILYYALQSVPSNRVDSVPGGGLHRSNAQRRTRRARRASQSSSSSEVAGDENANVTDNLQPLGDGETIIGETTLEDGNTEWWEDHLPNTQPRAGYNIVNLLFRVSEDNARRNGCVHRGCQCNSCGIAPIRGIRYRCVNCADFDLCETCESQGVHTKTHVFYKIRVPAPPFGPRQMQPVWYTGDPDTCRRSLPKALMIKLSNKTGFERPELEAFWEQWTFMANTEWRDDPDELNLAMDRKTFERCLVPTGGSRHAAPNLIHDRMFAFYDSNKDGYIGFSEFLHGLSYRKQRDKLRKVFEGYDIDADGYVSRKDFLRMFRAYYVLYKQMHKDILDGLEDQLLASTEAQQLVASRQPLSSLFGREGGLPHGDRSLRLDGKTLNRDGSVEVADGTGVVADSRTDSLARQDILTSLFAYDPTPRERWRLVTRVANHSEDYDQRIRNMRVTDADRPYLVTLIDPPTSIDELPDAVMSNLGLDFDDVNDIANDETEDEADDDEEDLPDEDQRTPGLSYPTETDQRIRALNYSRKRIPKLEKRRRDMARSQLHERWKRRQFYLDEEEGGAAPYDWEDNEDIFLEHEQTGESSKTGANGFLSARSRSNSRVRFADDGDDLETQTTQSVSSRGIPERWGGMGIPDAERDAGKEILYQVTQQAFNELLDTIFKPAEDIAVEARETKEEREKYKDQIEAFVKPAEQASDEDQKEPEPTMNGHISDDRPPKDKSLGELLSETGYSVAEDREERPRDAFELTDLLDPVVKEVDKPAEKHFDPTMPQNRPNCITWPEFHDWVREKAQGNLAPQPRAEQLERWQMLGKAEEQAIERGGWGKLSYAEFEEIYRSQEYRGNRLDYLGSWIDFCIPS